MWTTPKLSFIAILCFFIVVRSDPLPSSRKLFYSRSTSFQPIRVKFIDIGLNLGTIEETATFKSSVLPVTTKLLSQALSVKSLQPSSFEPFDNCDGFQVPAMADFGDADFYVFISSEPLEEQLKSKTCLNEAEGLEYPIMGRLRVSSNFQSLPQSIQKSGILRETIKMLGFSESQSHKWKKPDSSSYIHNSEVVISQMARGSLRKFLITPKVLSLAQSAETFNCASATGLELEDYEGFGDIGWHWDRRILFNEVMNYVLDLDMYLSRFTLAALEDSGWYQAHYHVAQGLIIGRNKGCSFLEDPCFFAGVNLDEDLWCDQESFLECDAFLVQKANCELTGVQGNHPVGPDPTTDSCPYRRSVLSPCRQSEDLSPFSLSFTFESFQENSRCFKSTLVQGPNPVEFNYAACYEVTSCSSQSASVKIAEQEVLCSFKGQLVAVPGFSGLLTCPDPSSLCQEVPCQDFCNGNGLCDRGRCKCFEGYKGPTCSNFCPENCENCSDAETCQKCSKGFYLKGLTCQPCTGLCTECSDETTCTKCQNSAYLEGSQCLSCLPQCKTCCGLNACMQCASGFELIDKYCCPDSCTRCDHSQCFECKDGLLLDKGKCLKCPETCKGCKNGKCFGCVRGFYLDSCSGCLECSCSCLECSDGCSCDVCKAGFFLGIRRLCEKCPEVCLECNHNVCVACKLGYHRYNDICCKDGCAQCTLDRCLSASFGYFLSAGSALPCPLGTNSCVAGFAISCNSDFQRFENTCIKCSSNCLQCTDKVCLKCVEPFFLTSSGSCIKCPSTCTSCLNSKCVGCYTVPSSDGFGCCPLGCTSCNSQECWTVSENYFLTEQKLCVACPESCSKCSSGVCVDCKAGFYISQKICTSCISPCATCTSLKNCLSCVTNFLLTDTGSCVTCPEGCKGCPESKCPDCVLSVSYLKCCPTGCSSCNDIECWTCFDNYWLTSTKECIDCPASCTKCSKGVCLDCIPGYFMQGTLCIRCVSPCEDCLAEKFCKSCVAGYLLASTGSCLECPEGCKGCPGSRCSACVLAEDYSRCCPKGCSSCNGQKCWTCDASLYLLDYQCVDCPPECSACSDGVCTGCKDGFFMSSTRCLACQAPCLTCYSETKCLTCEKGKLLTETEQCVACPVPCGECLDNKCCISADDLSGCCPSGCSSCNAQKCWTCFPGFWLSSDKKCLTCPEGCSSCLDGVCQSCNKGFYPSVTTCLKCQDSCAECTGPSQCTECLEQLLLDSTGSCIACPSDCGGCPKSLCNKANCKQAVDGSGCCPRGCNECNSVQCWNCLDNFFFDDSSKNCQDCPSTCTHCLNSVCQGCKEGFSFAGTTCA